MSNGGGARVPIPQSLQKTIQDIKEIAAGKHSDDDIYAMLKECNMDPNETAQRLLYLDTFHEVKKKRDKKKVDVNRTSDNYRRSSSMQRRGARGGRESYFSSNVSDDFGGRRKGSYRQENGISNSRGGSRAPTAVVQKKDDNVVPAVSSGPKNASDASQVSSGNTTVSSKSPAPSCTNISDTAVVQALSPQGPGAVENEAKWGAGREVEKNAPTASEIPSIPQAIKLYDLPETISDQAVDVQNNHNSWSAKQVYDVPKGVVSHAETVETQSSKTSLPMWNDASLDQTTPELDQKLGNLFISSHRAVIFPDHLQVPEALGRGLTFGSLDATLGQSANSDNVSMSMNENSAVVDLVGGEPSQSNHHASPIDKEGDNSAPPSHPQMTGISSTLGDDKSSAGGQKFDQSKQDRLGPAQHITLLQPTPEYGFGIMPPVLAPPPHITHLEGAEQQGSNTTAPSTSGSTPPVTQPPGLGQNSFALPPHLLPYLRQAYPSNLIPYNPYYSHLYMPHAPHQFLGHNILPQQPAAGNVYASPAAAAAGSKYPVPPILKTSSVGGNMTHFGIPSGYNSFGASNVGYSSTPAFSSGSSNGTEDIMAAELKENNVYPAALKQNEEGHGWTPTPGRDLSTLPPNYFYNVPPGHHMAFPPPHSTHGPPFPGVYHLNQAHPMPAPSSLQSFSQQPQAAGGAMEYAVPSSQLPHSQINWNNKLLNKENI